MKRTLNILNEIAVDVEIKDNRFTFELEDLFSMAARKNPKRAFLFVSKLLGKHIPINPKKGLVCGSLLGFITAEKIGEDINKDYSILSAALKDDNLLDKALEFANNNLIKISKSTLFIGFAETATALGNSTFAQFKGDNIYYIHTTRDNLKECNSAFDFEEEHSHATSHFCYPLDSKFLSKFERIVLIDDEITTGKTALNLIQSINKKYPVKEFAIVSILDWRTKEWIEEYKNVEEKLGININVVSLMDGEATCSSPSIQAVVNNKESNNCDTVNMCEEFFEDGNLISTHKEDMNSRHTILIRNYLFNTYNYFDFTRNLSNGEEIEYKYLKFSGRFGVSSGTLSNTEKSISKIVRKMQPFSKKTLVLGTEEFMYIPMLMASFIENAKYQSTTRSPIYVGKDQEYAIKHSIKFSNPFDKNVTNYMYNIGPKMYDEVLFVTERQIDKESKKQLVQIFSNLGINKLDFVYFC